MLREEHRLRVFENRVLRRIFECKRDEVIGGWRKLLDEVLHGLYSSPHIVTVIKIEKDEMGSAHSMHWGVGGEMRNMYKILIGKYIQKRPLGG
jgi:hypothetical protein